MQSYCHQIALLDRTMSLYCLLDSSRLEGYFELERAAGMQDDEQGRLLRLLRCGAVGAHIRANRH